MEASVVYVALDVHKDSIVIAVAREGREAAEHGKTIPNDAVRLQKALKLLLRTGERLKVCYEAGPTGFVLCRRLREAGIECLVVAPSLVPGKPGDRVKTDRRDARRLAHFLRSGDLTEVYLPHEAVEAIRDLKRARPRRQVRRARGAAPTEQVSPAARPPTGTQPPGPKSTWTGSAGSGSTTRRSSGSWRTTSRRWRTWRSAWSD
jgi:transposase